MDTSRRDFFTGLSSSFIVKKLGLLRLRGSSSTPAADGGFGYLRDWVWWAGLVTMGIGEASNFAAYAFAPAALVTPLGALSIFVSAVLAPKFLNEVKLNSKINFSYMDYGYVCVTFSTFSGEKKLNLLGKIGCMLCILGSIIIVVHAPKDGDVNSVQELNKKIFDSGFVYYVLVVVTLTIYTIKFIVPRYGKTNVAVYIFICSSIGSLSVMCCKGLGLCIRECMSNNDKSFLNIPILCFFIALLICIVVQMNYLNKALDSFSSNLVNPVHYIFFTVFVILASSILFQEWRRIAFVDIFATIIGLTIVIIALFLISAFNDSQITLLELYSSSSRKILK
uniref:Magnesium transporter NIPA2 n=1 Tax=Daphnia galeata TaxID=27404 RepID=A0A8J2RRW1_9CRUS|nr:unnamed protein product [Daphnia galeata]